MTHNQQASQSIAAENKENKPDPGTRDKEAKGGESSYEGISSEVPDVPTGDEVKEEISTNR